MTRRGTLALLACLGLASLSPPTGVAQEVAATIGVEEIQRGQIGYGISVFAGTTPERFEVEVLGVQRHPTAGNNAIITRLRGQGLEQSGVIAGMSGSPVYFDGRLAGAVAFSWSFSTGAIAGITPIAEMRAVAAASPETAARRTASAPASTPPLTALLDPQTSLRSLADLRDPARLAALQARAAERFSPDLLRRGLQPLAALGGDSGGLGAGVRPTFQWALGGFGETSHRLLADALGPGSSVGSVGAVGAVASVDTLPTGSTLNAVATAATGGPAAGDAMADGGGMDLTLQPGSPVSAVLVQGDLRLAAGGTVTDRQGDGVLAFGHPFLGFGPISIPMAAAEVITVVSSLSSSFKISNMGPIVGAFQEDRQAAIFGRMGAEARTIPVTVQMRGEGLASERTYRMRIADMPNLTPTLIALSVLGALDGSGHATGDQGLDLVARLRLENHGEVTLRQNFEGPNAGTGAAVYLLTLTGALLGSSFEEAHLEAVEVEVQRTATLRTTAIVGAFTPRTTVHPGQTIPVFLEMQPHRGERFRHKIEVRIPRDLGTGAYYLMVADGTTADAARQAVTPTTPTDYSGLLAYVRSLSSNQELHVLGLVGAPGLVVDGEALPQLPASVRADRTAAQPTTASGTQLALVQETRETLEIPLSGVVRVDLNVERR
jgi:hypothetical protein